MLILYFQGRCTRENPKCKYLHPPQHIKDQLLINGRNNLALKNLLSAQLNQSAASTQQLAVNPLLAQMVNSLLLFTLFKQFSRSNCHKNSITISKSGFLHHKNEIKIERRFYFGRGGKTKLIICDDDDDEMGHECAFNGSFLISKNIQHLWKNRTSFDLF